MLKQLPHRLDQSQLRSTAEILHVPALRIPQPSSVSTNCQALRWTVSKPYLGFVRMYGRGQQSITKWRSWGTVAPVRIPVSNVRIAHSHVRNSDCRSEACLPSQDRAVNCLPCQFVMSRGQPWGAAVTLGKSVSLLRPSRYDRCPFSLCSAHREGDQGGGDQEDLDASKRESINIAIQSGLLGVATTLLFSGTLTKDGDFLGYLIAFFFFAGILYQVFLLLVALDVGVGSKILGNCPWCGVECGVLEITTGLEDYSYVCPSCSQKFDVVDQIFVRRGPSFGDSERRRNNDDPSVGFAYPTQKKDAKNDRSDDRMKKTHFETKSKKGFGNSKGEKERHQNQKSEPTSRVSNDGKVWRDIVDIEASVRDKD